jgi:uncharacterized protein (TIGR02246 family)
MSAQNNTAPRRALAWATACGVLVTISFGAVIVTTNALAGQESARIALETRLRQLEDKDAIQDLLMEYGRRLDAGDWVGYAKLFARNGTWTGSFGTATGPEQILAMLQKSLGSMPPHDPSRITSFHLMTNCQIHLDGDHATALSRWTNFGRTDDNKLIPRLAGHYEDVFVREDGHWKFLTRSAPRDIPNP